MPAVRYASHFTNKYSGSWLLSCNGPPIIEVWILDSQISYFSNTWLGKWEQIQWAAICTISCTNNAFFPVHTDASKALHLFISIIHLLVCRHLFLFPCLWWSGLSSRVTWGLSRASTIILDTKRPSAALLPCAYLPSFFQASPHQWCYMARTVTKTIKLYDDPSTR